MIESANERSRPTGEIQAAENSVSGSAQSQPLSRMHANLPGWILRQLCHEVKEKRKKTSKNGVIFISYRQHFTYNSAAFFEIPD